MSLFDRFKSKKEKELAGEARRPEALAVADKGAETTQQVVEDKKTKTTSKAKTSDTASHDPVSKRLVGDAYKVLLEPVVTEKSAHQVSSNKYVFHIPADSNKVAVRRAIESAYKVHVEQVNVVVVRGKAVRFGRTRGKEKSWKKAIVTLRKGERIDVYEGV